MSCYLQLLRPDMITPGDLAIFFMFYCSLLKFLVVSRMFHFSCIFCTVSTRNDHSQFLGNVVTSLLELIAFVMELYGHKTKDHSFSHWLEQTPLPEQRIERDRTEKGHVLFILHCYYQKS